MAMATPWHGRPGGPPDDPIGEGEVNRVPVREGQVRVEKRPEVAEDLLIGKRVVRETERVADTAPGRRSSRPGVTRTSTESWTLASDGRRNEDG